jgi:hypothetical protein
MTNSSQNYANHRRWNPMFHYIASPIIYGYALYAIWLAISVPGMSETIHAIWAVGVAVLNVAARGMALRVQNRMIRLEMRLRMKELLPAALNERAKALTIRQLVALRFAGDAELAGLVERTLNGDFAKPNDIKRAITDWQADYMRA